MTGAFGVAVQAGALLCVVAGLAAAVLAVLTTGNGRAALRVALDFWLAAGLLRLALPASWRSLLGAAAIIAIRQLAGFALRRPAAAFRTPRPRWRSSGR